MKACYLQQGTKSVEVCLLEILEACSIQNQKPTLWAKWVVAAELRVMYFSKLCFEFNKRSSVLEEFSIKRFAVIQEERCCRMFCRRVTPEWLKGQEVELSPT